MKDRIQEMKAVQWVTEHNGQVVYRDDGTAAVELKEVQGVGLCPVQALQDWQKKRRRAK